MTKRDLELTPRKEELRDAKPAPIPTQFSLAEIKQHFKESLDPIKKQYTVADSLNNSGDIEGCKMIWRSQVVLAEGLLDFYIHEMSKYCLFRMFTGAWSSSEKYASFMVPMEKVEEALSAAQSKDWFFSYLNDRFSRDVFLSCESMRDQLNLIGIGFVSTMVKAFPRDKDEASKKEGAKIVTELFQRRNTIAHQNDRSHASAEQNDITKEYVEEYISKVETIVDAIHSLAEEKETHL